MPYTPEEVLELHTPDDEEVLADLIADTDEFLSRNFSARDQVVSRYAGRFMSSGVRQRFIRLYEAAGWTVSLEDSYHSLLKSNVIKITLAAAPSIKLDTEI